MRIILLALPLVSVVLTEVMLSVKIKKKNNTLKKVLFWIVAVSMSIELYALIVEINYGLWGFDYIIDIIICAISLVIIPLRIVFELVLIGKNIERNITLNNNQSESRLYNSNYSSNAHNN